MKRYILICDLKNNPALKKAYIAHHNEVWPAVVESILESGIKNMEIFNAGYRLVMVIEAADGFSFEEKEKLDAKNEKVQEWEELMWRYQKRIPTAGDGEKWVLMEKIFSLND